MKNKTPTWFLVTLATLAFGAAVTSAAPASAYDEFPGRLQATLKMPCAPRCNLCHATLQGGGKPSTKFGLQVFSKGPVGRNVAKLDMILAEQSTSDVDGDAVADVTELSQGLDPNVAGAASLCGPTYGCGARVAKAPLTPDGAAAAAAAITALLGALGLRRRRAPNH